MARYNTISLDTIYFTSNGLMAGLPCKTKVTGIDKAVVTAKRNLIQASDGEVYIQISPAHNKGLVITINFEFVAKTVFNSVNTLLNTKATTGYMALVLVGDTGTFSFHATPGQQPVAFNGEFSNGILRDVTYSFLTLS